MRPRKIEICPYELRPIARLSSRASQAPRQGALLRIEFEDGLIGHADCFVWPELGDLPLTEQLKSFKGRLTPLTRQALQFARIESKASSSGKSLFENAKIPENHFLWVQDLALLENELPSIWANGFKKIKLKLGVDLSKEIELLKKLSEKLSSRHLRVDFNHTLSPSDFEFFLKEMSSQLQIFDWIEDPCEYDPPLWRKFQTEYPIRLALDRLPKVGAIEKNSFKVLVVKPALLGWKEALNLAVDYQVNLAFTSYLDHPLGQLTAAYSAAQAYREDPHRVEMGGLLSHIAYEKSPYSDWISTSGSSLVLPQGKGWGLGFQLDALSWVNCPG